MNEDGHPECCCPYCCDCWDVDDDLAPSKVVHTHSVGKGKSGFRSTGESVVVLDLTSHDPSDLLGLPYSTNS